MTENRHAAMYVAEVDTVIPPYIKNDFSKYDAVRKLTQGGKAILSVAKDTNLGREVVIKRLRPELREDQRELKRLIREARITAQLSHTGTVPVHELGRDLEGNWYFAMKRVEGRSLFEILVSLAKGDAMAMRRFTLNRLLGIFSQTCDTLAYAHVRGIIHRDVKPENILVGNFGEVILLDWGVAKIWGMPNEGDADTIRERGGTPLYMAPEQVLGHYYIDERVDIFSLGIVLYELLAVKEPFRGRVVRDTFANIVHEDPLPPSEANPDRHVPKRLEEICLKALQKNPRDRYQSVSEMVGEIDEFVEAAIQQSSV